MLDFNLKTDSIETIQNSFDRIATELIHNYNLKVNLDVYSFTEIEFYFFLQDIHEDNSTHKHNYEKGQWRPHSKGLDITFQSSKISDGGILIRGLKKGSENVNGPIRILQMIFASLGSVMSTNKDFGLIPKPNITSEIINKTTRFGLSNNQNNSFKDSLYRYYIDLDNWNSKHVSKLEKEKIKSNSQNI